MDVVERRRAESEGELFTGSSADSNGVTDPPSLEVSSMPLDMLVDTRGVFKEADEGGRRPVRDLTEAEDLDCGREDVSGASSKVSCFIGQRPTAVLRKMQTYSFLVGTLSTVKLCVPVGHIVLCWMWI